MQVTNDRTLARRNSQKRHSAPADRKETGVTRGSIRRFVAGKQSLRLDKAEIFADYFGLELTRRKPK